MVKITDIYGNYYDIPDIQRFKEHIIKYHTIDGKAVFSGDVLTEGLVLNYTFIAKYQLIHFFRILF